MKQIRINILALILLLVISLALLVYLVNQLRKEYIITVKAGRAFEKAVILVSKGRLPLELYDPDNQKIAEIKERKFIFIPKKAGTYFIAKGGRTIKTFTVKPALADVKIIPPPHPLKVGGTYTFIILPYIQGCIYGNTITIVKWTFDRVHYETHEGRGLTIVNITVPSVIALSELQMVVEIQHPAIGAKTFTRTFYVKGAKVKVLPAEKWKKISLILVALNIIETALIIYLIYRYKT